MAAIWPKPSSLGLLKSGRAASDILVSDPNPESRKAISALGVAAFDHHEPVMAQAEFMILAVKPQMMDAVLTEIAPSLRSLKSSFRSLRASRFGGIRRRLNEPKNTVVRVMPNTPALIGEGMSALASDTTLDDETKSRCNASLNPVGRLFGCQVKMPSIR